MYIFERKTELTSLEALQELRDWVEYFTRLDYVPPIVRGDIQKKFFECYHGTLKHFDIIEKDLKMVEQSKTCIYVYEELH